ncbi:MAG: NPCBM/NEW2 domain-containing protein, partial [Gemmataceae bacterium]|nr:NPCBM/NEW2 domain-containing protein [Gemmataceae bacterium]
PTRIDILRPDVPPELVGVVRRLLSKAPQQRPASAAEAAALLAPFAAPNNGASQKTVAQANDSSAPPPSLVDRQVATPEHGFTLVTESAVQGPPSSMSYERGWTLTTESVPPQLHPLSSEGNRGGPHAQHSAREQAAPAAVEIVPALAPVALLQPAPTPSTHARLGLPIVLGIAGVGVLLIVLVVVLLQGQSGAGTNSTAKDKLKRPAVKVDPPQILASVGPNEKADPYPKPFDFDPKLAKPPADGKVFLTELLEFDIKGIAMWWKFGKNGRLGDPNNSIIEVSGNLYLKGLSTHPPNHASHCRVCFVLGKKASSLHGAAGLADYKGWGPAPTRFVIMGDDKVRWRSNLITKCGDSEAFNLDVKDVDVLELRVYVDGIIADGSRAVWLDPYLLVD